MIRLRPACLLLLVLSLGLATVGFGVARGTAPAAGQMVICTGHGIITVTVDARGNPVESHTLCPDAAPSLLAATALAPPLALPCNAGLAWRNWPQGRPAPDLASRLHRGARGPPSIASV